MMRYGCWKNLAIFASFSAFSLGEPLSLMTSVRVIAEVTIENLIEDWQAR